jgi:hypothetical protein
MGQLSGLDRIDDIRFPVSWLVDANTPQPDEKRLKFQA